MAAVKQRTPFSVMVFSAEGFASEWEPAARSDSAVDALRLQPVVSDERNAVATCKETAV